MRVSAETGVAGRPDCGEQYKYLEHIILVNFTVLVHFL